MDDITKETKIDIAIYNTKLCFEKVKQDILLLKHERDVLIKRIDDLERIKNDDSFI